MRTKLYLMFMLLLATQLLKAQDSRLLELSVGGEMQQMSTPFPYNDLYFYNISSQVLYKINPYLSAGLAYHHSFSSDGSGDSKFYFEPKTQSYGVVVKGGTNRYKRFSVYGIVGFNKIERADRASIEDFTISNGKEFTISSSGVDYYVGVGAMLTISRSVSLKIFEYTLHNYSASLNYFESKSISGTSVETGFVFMLLRKK